MSEERDNGISKAPRTMTTHEEMPETSDVELFESVISSGSQEKGWKNKQFRCATKIPYYIG